MGCGEAVIQIPHAPRAVVLLVDTSRSMATQTWDHDSDPNTPEIMRWSSTSQAVQDFALTYPHAFDFGLVLFPGTAATEEYGVQACLTSPAPDLPVGPDNEAELLAALPAADALVGATPTRAGFEVAVAHLGSLADPAPRAIVLITDGVANCKPDAIDDADLLETVDQGLVDVVAAAYSSGISTFVVGVDIAAEVSPIEIDGEPDGVDAFEALDAIALAGGVPSDDPEVDFYLGSTQAALHGALDAIAAALVPCVLDLDIPPLYPDAVELLVGDVDYGTSDVRDCASEDGWRPLDPDFKQIELCGQACVDARKEEHIFLHYKCPGSG